MWVLLVLPYKREGVITDLTNKKEKELKEDALAKVIASEKTTY